MIAVRLLAVALVLYAIFGMGVVLAIALLLWHDAKNPRHTE